MSADGEVEYICWTRKGLESRTYVVVPKMDVPFILDHLVEHPVDNPQRVEVQPVRAPFGRRPAVDLVVLLLEEAHDARPVVPAVALGPQADAVVGRAVVREL